MTNPTEHTPDYAAMTISCIADAERDVSDTFRIHNMQKAQIYATLAIAAQLEGLAYILDTKKEASK